jgi:hypothetical protein
LAAADATLVYGQVEAVPTIEVMHFTVQSTVAEPVANPVLNHATLVATVNFVGSALTCFG